MRLFYILSGADQPVGTMFQIFSVIIETIKDPLFAPITFDWDLDKRQARIEVPGAVRAHSEPIRNPVTDEEHQMLTVLPNGWVFHEAENVAGFAKGTRPDPVRPEPTAQLDGECRLGAAGLGPQLRRVQAEIRPALTLTCDLDIAGSGAAPRPAGAGHRRLSWSSPAAWVWLLLGAGMGMTPIEMTRMAGMDGWLMQPAQWSARLRGADVLHVVGDDGGDDAAQRRADAAAVRPRQPPRTDRRRSAAVRPACSPLGYLIAWGGFSAVAVALQWALEAARLLSPMLETTTRLAGRRAS